MREYFGFDKMTERDMKEFQKKVLETLLYFNEFCQTHNLRFFLCGGSAIGAIRHHGFIPWDEDIDVFMPRPDFERLTKLWPKTADIIHYSFCRTDAKKNYHHHAASIVNNCTTYIERHNQEEEIKHGIVMDVIPLDGCAPKGIPRVIQLFWAFLFALFNAQRIPENKNVFFTFSAKLLLKIITNPKLRYKIWKKAEKNMTKYPFYSSKEITELIGAVHGMLIRHPADEFNDVVYFDFEGHTMPLMIGYKSYLKSVFGNFMELPPKEKRIPKSDVVYINLDEGYKKFKGTYYCRGNI